MQFTKLCRNDDPIVEEVKISAIGKTSNRESVPQSNSPWEEAVRLTSC